jgi:hypothetical protein
MSMLEPLALTKVIPANRFELIRFDDTFEVIAVVA